MRTRAARLALVATVVVGMLAGLAAPASGASWSQEVLDGDGPTPDGRTGGIVGWDSAGATLGDQPHVWYHDVDEGTLRHSWYAPGGGWRAETLDGNSDLGGRTTNHVGRSSAVLLAGGLPHVFYYDDTDRHLRHTWYVPGRGWNYEVLDGNTATGGRTTNDVGTDLAVTLIGETPHLFYHDGTDRDLRHTWYVPGRGWSYEVLDGNTATGGRTTNDVGTHLAVTLIGETPHVFHHDATAGDLRHSWYLPGRGWVHEVLDGNTVSDAGKTTRHVGWFSAAVASEGTPHVFYHDLTEGELRHAWYGSGIGWRFEALDGHTSADGRTENEVGTWNAAALIGAALHVFHADSTDGDLRHAWFAPTGWTFETLDGDTDAGRRTDAEVGTDTAVLVSGGRPHVWYHDTSSGLLRHAWFT